MCSGICTSALCVGAQGFQGAGKATPASQWAETLPRARWRAWARLFCHENLQQHQPVARVHPAETKERSVFVLSLHTCVIF